VSAVAYGYQASKVARQRELVAGGKEKHEPGAALSATCRNRVKMWYPDGRPMIKDGLLAALPR